ncbi:unnamed protein product [Sphagnum jensenii]|uniref:Uncharacterized protein n=1 Tax=Sphagnum jensenii TaxID=128206 RepID=A0ABP0WP72_9BRYO
MVVTIGGLGVEMAGMVQQPMVACSGSSSSSGCVMKRTRRSSLNTTALASLQSRRLLLQRVSLPRICAVKAPEECNEEEEEEEEEESAVEKEVGKLSMKWEAEEKTKLAGTYSPVAQNERRWTGYIEKDTAGQTNIYSVEPTVYVAESAISTGSAGGSSEGTNKSLAIAVGLGLVAVASALSILLLVGKNTLAALEDSSTYSGPPLSYYITKFNPTVAVQAEVSEASPLDN